MNRLLLYFCSNRNKLLSKNRPFQYLTSRPRRERNLSLTESIEKKPQEVQRLTPWEESDLCVGKEPQRSGTIARRLVVSLRKPKYSGEGSIKRRNLRHRYRKENASRVAKKLGSVVNPQLKSVKGYEVAGAVNAAHLVRNP